MGARKDFTVVVAGDVTYNWNIARNEGDGAKTAHASFQAGGAALLRELVAKIAEQPPDGLATPARVLPEEGPRAPCPTDDHFNQRFAVWSRHTQDTEKKDETQVWRVREFLGGQRASAETPQPAPAAVEEPVENVDLVAIHDANLGFRDNPELWPRAIQDPAQAPPWILLRTVQPIGTGPLCDRLQPFADRTIVVIRIDDIRLGGMHVTRELSWERTAQDLLAELCANEHLGNCAHVVVSFTTAGALVLSRPPGGDGERDCRLIFDPAVMERMWNERHPGDMIGGVTALTASIVREVIREAETPDVPWAVQRGIKAMRKLDLEGYDEKELPFDELSVDYPFDRVAPELCREPDPDVKKPFAEAPVSGRSPSHPSLTRIFGEREKPWTILEDRHHEDLLELATKMVEEGGARALPEVPRGEFGKLLTFDRGEIEGLQSIRGQIHQYDQREHPSHPLSLAVFGPPGAGKSWSVRQVAGSVIGDRATSLTFNLSQFDDPRGLIDALHQVRDVSLSDKLPLVLWDEFDTTRVTAGGQQKLGWLPHFLSPMEDGTFQEGQLTHPIGPAVFVFAGGVYERMERFAADAKDVEDAKAPDFVSRLSGYLDVAGPNPRGGDRRRDPYFVVRRAVQVRSMLDRAWKGIFHTVRDENAREEASYQRPEIDFGVLTALLLTKEYRHGSRSLESIIAGSVVPGQDSFGRSDLPSEAQLDLHLDAQDFLRIVRETPARKPEPEPAAVG